MNTRAKGARASTAKPVLRLSAVTPIKQFAAPLDAKSSAYVNELSELLSLARRGKLTGFMWIGGQIKDDGKSYLFYNPPTIKMEDPVSALGLLEVMKREILQELHQ